MPVNQRAAVGLLLLAMCACPLAAAEPEVQPEDLRPGLIVTHRDPAKSAVIEIVQVEPSIALGLKAGEAPHPRLVADGGTTRWEGYLNVPRPGAYRFRVTLRGKFRLSMAGKEVLGAEVKDDNAVLKEGPEVQLEAGVFPLLAEFTRLPGRARVELFWQSAFFRNEPLPYDAVGHLPKKAPARLESDTRADHGRFLAEEHNCAVCHRPTDGDRLAKGMSSRQGPDLSQVGQRTYAGWLYHWLESPQKIRPGSTMPQLFSDDEAGRVERYAVARYLVSLGGPLRPTAKQPNAKEMEASVNRGRQLFTGTGCAACHTDPQASGERKPINTPEGRTPLTRRWEITGLGNKTMPDKLAAYLQNPLAVDPSGRMPNLLLQPKEAEDLARYLCQNKDSAIDIELPAAPGKDQMKAAFQRVDKRADELAAFQRLSADEQFLDLGKRLVIDKGCNSCHTIAPGGKPFASMSARASFDDIKSKKQHEIGCLTNDKAKRGSAPWFGFGDDQKKSLRLFLAEGATGAGSPAPMHEGRTAFKRFNCLACHSRNGKGGLSPDLIEELRKVEKAENAEAVSPPPLTGVGHKLRTPWLREVMTKAGRARPWMGLRMPQFGEANVGQLPEILAALEGAEPDDQIHRVSTTAAKLDAGRHLVGKNAFGCINCHDLAGNPTSGTRGPDLAAMNQRVRYDWYRRWLEQPQRLQPGTRMPSVFSGGKTLLDDVLGGSAEAQADAMWGYLSLGPNLPLPAGMEPTKGLVLTVKDRPVLLRTFMPEAGVRAIAVGYPGGVSLAFDAQTCRLAYAWSGNFLDVSPVWNDRGGSPAKILGSRFWTAPPGCPWNVAAGNDPPDFAAQAKDPAFGGPVPYGKVYDGPQQLLFEGYSTDKTGLPMLRYVVHAAEKKPAQVSERPEPLRSAAGVGVARRFTLHAPAQQTPWLFAGEAKREPRLFDTKAEPIALDWKSGTAEVPAAGRLLVLPQDSDRVVVLVVAAAPEGSRWHLRRVDGTWQALLRLPRSAEAGKVEVGVNVWVPYRDEAGLLKELVSSK